MLETIREYALERLEASGEVEAIRDQHARFFLELSGGDTPRRLFGDELHAWLNRLEPDHDNLRAALGWSVERVGGETTLRLATNLSQFWYVRGHFSEGRRWLDRALAGPLSEPRMVAAARTGASMLARAQGDHRVAATHAEAAVAAAREAGDPRTTARALYILGVVRQFLGDADSATDALEEALPLARAAGDGPQMGSILNVLGDATYARGDHVRAVELVEEGLALKRAAGDAVGAGVCLNMLGTMALAERDLPQAAARFEEALALFRGAEDPENVAIALNNLGGVARDRGEDGKAVGLIVEALIAFRDLGDRSGVAFGLEGLGFLAHRQASPVLAARWMGASSTIREAIGEPIPVEQRADYDAVLIEVRERMGEAAFAEAWAAGRGLAQETVLAEALAWADEAAADAPHSPQ
jgi:tetratricopeptide (TPR) repeat protein